jgi:Flp pilus assembly protein TadD
MRQLFHAGAAREAAAMGWALLKADPRDPLLLNLLALAEHKLGNHGAALVLLQRAIKANPRGTAHWNDMGNVYCAIGDTEAARDAYSKAIECDPRCAEACNNMGVLAGDCKQFEEARSWYEKALLLKPDYPDVLCNLGIALAAMGKYQKAVRRYEQAIKLQPDLHKAHFNLSLVRLVLGDLAGGWKEWDSRWNNPQMAPAVRKFPQPAWTGEPLGTPPDGKRIFLYAEQGIGDTLQFIRYIPMVIARGGQVILEVQPPLVPLFAPLLSAWAGPGPEIILLAQKDPIPAFDTHCAFMSLPVVFATTLATIPFPEGYLRAPALPTVPEPAPNAFRVGLVWAGSPTHKLDHQRSMPLSALRPLLDLPGIHWFSLQKGEAASQLASQAALDPLFASIEDTAATLNNYADTANLIHSLDLVITVDTSVAHLAGAMGKPVWVLIQHHLPDWRWLLKRKDSPWYKSARLFRQPSEKDWPSVIANVASELRTLQAAPSS